MIRRIKVLVLLAMLVLTSACSSAKFIPTGPTYEARPDDCPIEVFSTKLPERDYEELGLIEGEGSLGDDTLEKILPKMKREACRAAGDAIILLFNQKAVKVWDDTSDEKLLVTATVVRWVE